jgi:hypothetical protein
VAFRAGGIPETIADGRNGRLVEPFDRQGLAGAIAALLLDTDTARTLGRAAAEAIRPFSLDRQAEAYEAILADLAASSGWRAGEVDRVTGITGSEDCRVAAVPLLLDPVLAASPVGPVLAAQIDALAAQVEELATDREVIRAELAAVKENRDGLHAQLVAANDRSTARDAELALLKGRLVNRLILKLRSHLLSRVLRR